MTGKTYFSIDGCLFPKVPENGLILTKPFLDASDLVLVLLDKFGAAYYLVKSDVAGNIKKLRTKYAMNPELYVTIDAMLHDEVTKKDSNLATDAALWLKRGLDFLCTLFENFLQTKLDETDYFSPCVHSACDKVLKPHHGFATQKIFSVFSKLLPYRSQFIDKLKEDESVDNELVWSEMKVYVDLLRENVQALDVTLKKYNLDSPEKA